MFEQLSLELQRRREAGMQRAPAWHGTFERKAVRPVRVPSSADPDLCIGMVWWVSEWLVLLLLQVVVSFSEVARLVAAGEIVPATPVFSPRRS
jgi:hypothetical protein